MKSACWQWFLHTLRSQRGRATYTCSSQSLPLPPPRYGSRTAEPSGGKRRTRRKGRVDLLTTPTRPPAAGSPWTRRRSPGGSWRGWIRRSASRSGGCSSRRTSCWLGIYFTPRARTATAGCRTPQTVATTSRGRLMTLSGDTKRRRAASRHLTLCRARTTTKDTWTRMLDHPNWTHRATGPACAPTPTVAEPPACRNSALSAWRASCRTPDRGATPRPYPPRGL